MRILLADDHEVVRRGLRALLEARPGWRSSPRPPTGARRWRWRWRRARTWRCSP
jgi:hypothetical protein